MDILLFDMGSFTYQDIRAELVRSGHNVEVMYYHFKNKYEDIFFEERINITLSQRRYDAVVSVNFFPLLAKACMDRSIPYVSWSYDSPLDEKLVDYFGYDTNHIFLFDRAEVKKYNVAGFNNVYHLPLAINTERLGKLKLCADNKYRADISFVGSLYNSELDTLLYTADDYVKGYVEGLFQAQLQVYGGYFLEETISEHVMELLNDNYARIGQKQIKLSKKGLAFSIAKQITHIERSFLVNEFAENYDVHIYTGDSCQLSDKVKVHGPVKYFDDMNKVFVSSKLNLCPTLRCIESGIPLRALDVLGVGGVLFSNFQPELAEYFIDGEDVIMYESIEDAFVKADFYLANDNALDTIAKNGHKKVKELFDYSKRIAVLLGAI